MNHSLLTINNIKRLSKSFSPSNVEWHNSVYFFNKNNIKHFPVLDNVVLRIIKAYINMYNLKAEKSIELYGLSNRRRWLSLDRRIWVGKLDLKHTNDNVVINVFTYDKINNLVIRRIRQILNYVFTKRCYTLMYSSLFRKRTEETVRKARLRSKGKLINNYLDFLFIKFIKMTNAKFNKKLLTKIKSTFSNSYSNELNNSIGILVNPLRTEFTKNLLKYEMDILYYKKFIILNSLKYKNTFISILQKFIGKMYNKKVVFNIISLKNLYMHTDILTKILAHQSKDRNKSTYFVLGNAMSLIKTHTIQKRLITRVTKKKYFQKVTIKDNDMQNKETLKDNLNIILGNYYNSTLLEARNEVLNTFKNKLIVGVRLEGAGRLTKRFTAQRSLNIVRHKGTLKNVDSSFKGIPTQILRNNRKNSIQFSKASSQNRIGSFGIKGWINSI